MIGAVEKRGRWIYGNYIKFMESWQARSRKGLLGGGGHFELETATSERQAFVSDSRQQPEWGACQGLRPSGAAPGDAFGGDPIDSYSLSARGRSYPPTVEGRLRQSVLKVMNSPKVAQLIV